MIFRQNWTTLTNNWLVRCSETWISDSIERTIKRYYRLCWRSLPVCFGLNLSPCCHLSPTTTTIIHHTSFSHHSAHVSTKSWHKCYACYAVSLRSVHFTRSFCKFAEQPQLKFFNSKKMNSISAHENLSTWSWEYWRQLIAEFSRYSGYIT